MVLGKSGLQKLAETCYTNAKKLREEAKKIDGVTVPDEGYLWEFPIFFEDASWMDRFIRQSLKKGIDPGIVLEREKKGLLVYVNELVTDEDISLYIETLRETR